MRTRGSFVSTSRCQKSWTVVVLVALAFSVLLLPRAPAVPSYTRQTGLACNVCHTTFPELTPFGRQFKLNGYTLTGMKEIIAKSSRTEAGMKLNEFLPVSAMFQISDTLTNKSQPGTQNRNVEFPQALSVFLAGSMGPKVGSFLQVTYTSVDDHFTADNTDIRYADHGGLLGKSLTYGLTFNNNPTVEDLWNDTPAWSFPWAASDSAPTPNASSILSGSLAQDVAGLGAYAMWNEHLYGVVTAYRSAHIGVPQPPNGQGAAFNIDGAAPYWRAAWQQNLAKTYLEVGTYGMHLSSFPNSISGPTDRFTDVAADFQWEIPHGRDLLTLHGNYIHENSDLFGSVAAGLASTNSHHLNQFRGDGVYHFGTRYTAGFGWFNDTGTADPLLFPAAAVTGSANGSPANNGWIAQAGFWPIQNIEVLGQYTGYLKFNGARHNYDGFGRNASDNNTLYLLLWFVF